MNTRIPFSKSLQRAKALSTAGALFALLAWGCDTPQPINGPERAGFTGFPQAPVAEAVGWDELKVVTGGADVTLDSFGHYSISRNACWVAGSGALAAIEWNQIAPILNQVAARLQQRPRPEPGASPSPIPKTCVAVGSTARALAGTGNLRIQAGARPAERIEWITPSWQAWGNEICYDSDLLPSAEEATALSRSLDRWLLQAFSEDCTIAP